MGCSWSFQLLSLFVYLYLDKLLVYHRWLINSNTLATFLLFLQCVWCTNAMLRLLYQFGFTFYYSIKILVVATASKLCSHPLIIALFVVCSAPDTYSGGGVIFSNFILLKIGLRAAPAPSGFKQMHVDVMCILHVMC